MRVLASSIALAVALAGCGSDSSTLNGGGGSGSSGSTSSSGSSSGDTSTSSGGSSGSTSGDPVLDDARAYTLQKINEYRAQAGVPPYALDDKMNDFSQAASTELSQDHQPHQYFIDHAAQCGCGVYAENQGSPTGWLVAPIHTQIDQILSAMMSEGPGGGHHDNIVSANYQRIGVGIVNPGAKLYFTNDFGK